MHCAVVMLVPALALVLVLVVVVLAMAFDPVNNPRVFTITNGETRVAISRKVRLPHSRQTYRGVCGRV
jgi:hypothetical protein